MLSRSCVRSYGSLSGCSCPVSYWDQGGVGVIPVGPRLTISAGGSARKTRTGLGLRSAICCAHTVPASSCPEGQACPKGRSSDWERKLTADVHHRIAQMLRCILSIPTEMQSISENDFECFASTGVK